MGKGMKKLLAVVLIVVLIGGAAYYLIKAKGYETGVATLSDVLNSKSERNVANTPTIVSHESPYYTLIGTPVALYYEKTTTPPTGFAFNVAVPYVNISVTTLIPGSEWMVRYASPLLVVCDKEPSRAVIRFFSEEQYGNPPVVTIGDIPNPLSSDEREWEPPTSVTLGVTKSFEGSAKSVSLNVAKYFWKSSDGVILVKNNQNGYNQAVVAVALASYVNIPVIVTDTVDENVAKTLESLGVKYSLVCGDMKGYKLTKRFSSVEEIQDWSASVVRQRLGENDVSYITMANPMDIYEPNVLNPYTPSWSPVTDKITNSAAKSYPGRPEMGEGPAYYFDVPYMYANVKVDVTMDISHETWGDDSGARIYVYVGVDGDGGGLDEKNENDKIQFFGGSPAYENTGYNGDPTGEGTYLSSFDRKPKSGFAHFYTEIPVFNDKGQHCVQLLAKIPTDKRGGPLSDMTTTYTLSVTVEELDSYVYPRLHDVSSLAPYLTAYRKGVVLAKPEYMIYDDAYVSKTDSSNPATNKELTEPTNNRTGEVKKELNNLLGRLAGMPAETDSDIIALANYYASKNDNGNYTYLGIMADPQMIPQYYYPSSGLGQDSLEGYLVPGDIVYSDIDADLDNPPYDLNEANPSLELADGRITGFNVQDVSALLCRTFFYSEIIENMAGPENGADPRLCEYWKNSAFSAIGTEPPVGATMSAAKKLGMVWEDAGFKVGDVAWSPATGSESSRQAAAWYYESANFVYICSHGFFYWYVPTGIRTYYYRETGAGGAFDVAHVKLMNFGPSVIWTDSCVTGRIDGLQMYNCLSNAFLHSGFNCYFGGTRSMWGTMVPMPDQYSGEKFGSLIAIYLYGYMTGYMWESQSIQPAPVKDVSTGVALMLAKNYFVVTQGTDGPGENDDTIEEVILHGDPAFNPYEPNHEGGY